MSTPHWLNISFLSIMSKSAIAYSCQNKCFRMKYILELKAHCFFYYLPMYFPSVDFQIILRNESDLWQSSLHNYILSNYRVSQKKCPHVSNCHNSFKIGTRNKSRMSFEILRKSSCWWALKFFNLDFWGLRKWGLKLVTLCLKAWPNQHFSGPVCDCDWESLIWSCF